VATTDCCCRRASALALGRAFSVDDTSLDHGLMLWDACVAFLRWRDANPREAARCAARAC
jgi:hypothetical protein